MKKKYFVLSALWLPLLGSAQNADSVSNPLQNEVIVTESRTPARFSSSLRNTTVITVEDIKKLPAINLQEILMYVNSVDIRQRGPGGVQADISVRGGSFEQTLVLIDGIKLSDPQTGHHLLNIPIQAADIERIEILRGSGSRIFGQNAFGGAINIITKKDYKKAVNIGITQGDFGLQQHALSGSFEIGEKYGNRISLLHSQSDGYKYNTDFRQLQGTYQGVYRFNENSSVTALAGTQEKNFGAQNFYTPPAAKYSEYEKTKVYFGNVGAQFKKLYDLRINANWRQNHDEFRLWRDSLHKGINLHTTNVYSIDANMAFNSGAGITSVGAELRKEDINSTSLGIRTRTIAGFFVEQRVKTSERFLLVGGANISNLSGFGWIAFPGVEAGYFLRKDLLLTANVGRSFRLPTYTELYYTDGGKTSVGNAALKPEASINYEAGLKWRKQHFNLSGTAFVRSGKSLIDWQKDSATAASWVATNIATARVSGVEAQGEIFPGRMARGLRWFERLQLSYSYLDVQGFDTEKVSRYVFDNLQHQVVLGSFFQWHKHVRHSVTVRYNERMGYSSYWVMDSRVMYNTGRNYSLFAEITNLTNTKYVESLYITMPGRWLRVGLNLTL